ncbi:DUF2490 domain-containing protein [Parapedobacter sp.]
MNSVNYRWGFLLPVVCMLVCPTTLSGQTRTNGWFRFTGRYRFSEKLTTDLEVQHRRQQDGTSGYPLRHAALYSIRPWVYYRINDGVRIDAAPLAYYVLYPAVTHRGEKSATPTTEYRNTVGISLRHRLLPRLWITDRTLWEYRNFSRGKDILRGRARLGLQYNLSTKTKVIAQEELLFNLHGAPTSHLFDHDRLSLSVQVPIGSRFYADMGYMHANRLPLLQTGLQKEHNIFLQLTIDFTSTDKRI